MEKLKFLCLITLTLSFASFAEVIKPDEDRLQDDLSFSLEESKNIQRGQDVDRELASDDSDLEQEPNQISF